MKRIYIILLLGLCSGLFAQEAFFSGTGGVGYDSNIYLDSSALGSFAADLALDFSWKSKNPAFQFFFLGNGEGSYRTYFDLSAFANAGIMSKPVSITFIKAFASYSYVLNLHQKVGGTFIWKQDIGALFTSTLGYDYQYTRSVLGLVQEDYNSHNVWIGGNMDFFDLGFIDLEGEYKNLSYPSIAVNSETLKNNILSARVLLTLQPGYNWEWGIGYKFSSSDANTSTLYLPTSTNSLALYNDSKIHGVELNVKWDIDLANFIEWNNSGDLLMVGPASDKVWEYCSVLKYTHYFSEQFKMEIPVSFSGRVSDLIGNYQRLEAMMYYAVII